MRSKTQNVVVSKTGSILTTAIACALLGALAYAAPESKEKAAAPSQKTFATPEDAAKALIEAATDFDVPALLQILGPDGKDLVQYLRRCRPGQDSCHCVCGAGSREELRISGFNAPSRRPSDRQRRLADADSNHQAKKRTVVLRFRLRAYRGPIPAHWRKRTERHISLSRFRVEAQHEYASTRHDGAEVNQYAQRLISTPGKHDGLAWQNPDGSWDGPVGEAAAEGYGARLPGSRVEPYHGYYFKVLKGQGPDAPLGELDFVVEGAMLGGFALVASPAQYRVTGVETFMVGFDGKVYQKDLGADTLTTFKSMELYNPDKTWRVTDDEP